MSVKSKNGTPCQKFSKYPLPPRLENLQRFRDFVSRGFIQTLINLTPLSKFCGTYWANKLSNVFSNIDSMELSPTALHIVH